MSKIQNLIPKLFRISPSSPAGAGRGMTLLLVVLLLSALLSISVGIFTVMFGELRISGEATDSFIALYAADEGVERLLYLDLVADSLSGCAGADPCSYGPVSLSFPSGACATVQLTRSGNGQTTARATGEYRCGGGSRAVRRAFQTNYQKPVP